MDKLSLKEVVESFKQIQDDICLSMEKIDGGSFKEDLWSRPGGGGGRTRIIEGDVIEKGGVNFSHVNGKLTDKMSDTLKVDRGSHFDATGVSIVMHPKNPFIPIIHMNIRYFDLDGHDRWFGGGIDLTPIYIDMEEAKFFHQTLKDRCNLFNHDYYAKFKDWADRYFYLPHRKESRGVGGIFFDHLGRGVDNMRSFYDFTTCIGNTFIPIYNHIINKKVGVNYNKEHLAWQALRRSRYVEFNLVWDRGTKFGLETNGRTESILMSMPPSAKWVYDYKAKPDSQEELTQNVLSRIQDWI